MTNAFTEIIDSKYYLKDLEDIFLASNMSQLTKLRLGQNEIWSIYDNLFCSLDSLMDLYLENNQINDINFGFSCIKNLRFLDLSYNKIKRLRTSTLHRIDDTFHQPHKETDPPRILDLRGNPFVCDCNLLPFQRWLKTTTANLHNMNDLRWVLFVPAFDNGLTASWERVQFSADKLFVLLKAEAFSTVASQLQFHFSIFYRCYTGTPDMNAGRRIVNVQSLICESKPHATAGSGITHVLLIILIILVGVLITALLYINREKVKANVQPLVSFDTLTFSQKNNISFEASHPMHTHLCTFSG